jgi:hypothetical protein
MKTMAVAAWKWILVGVLVAIIGVLLVVGGRKRGTRLYRLRMSLWTTVLALLGGGMLLVGCPADKGDGSKDATDTATQDEQRMCYADIQQQPDEMGPTCYIDMGGVDGTELPPPTCYAIDAVTPPPDAQEVSVMCYKDAGALEEVVPTCYKPLPPDAVSDAVSDTVDVGQPDVPGPTCYAPPFPQDAVTDAVDAGQPDVPGPTCYAPPFPEDVSDQEAQEEVVPQPDVPGPTCYMPPPPERR